MYFSTYRNIAYAGMVVAPFLLFGMFYLATQSFGDAAAFAIILGLVLIPLQFWQLSRLQSRLDDYGGSIPLGWAFDWDLEDDAEDSGASSEPTTPRVLSSPPTAPALPGAARFCDSCGRASSVAGGRFCPFCGSALAAAP